MQKEIALTLVLLALPGCLARTVSPLASEHAAQTQIVANRCRDEARGYADAPCTEKLQSDLDAMAEQARCIEAIMHGKTCEAGQED